MLSPTNNKHYLKKTIQAVLLIAWIGLLGWVVLNRQALVDWWLLRDYQAPAAVAALAGDDTMTDYGRKVFYVNKPAIQDRQQFFENCPESGGEQTIVLGCYHAGQGGIYILNVNDPRLEGVKKVTAAHEMLHAAYDRLSSSERKRVDSMLQSYYQNGLRDERVKKTVDAYKQTEPHDVVNEMHSIFGTEIGGLPADLEDYYRQYFDNRAAVVSFAANYQAEFTSRRQQVERYDEQLAGMKNQIDNLEADLKAKQSRLNSEQARLENLRKTDQIAAYNAGVAGYNALIDSYNAEVGQIKALINRYNALVAERNQVALEEGQLVKELSGDNVDTINN